MELLLIIVGYTAVLTVCYVVGEYLGKGRWITPTDDTNAEQFADAPPQNKQFDQEPSQDELPPLEAEVLPDPQQVARQLGEQFEGIVRGVAKEFGVELSDFATYCSSSATKGEFTDLDEIKPQKDDGQ